jgi:DNA-binding NarL/FixJ family response regulator
VLYLLGQGDNWSEIACRLRISPRAVDEHSKHIQGELGLTEVPAAPARYARRLVRSRDAA